MCRPCLYLLQALFQGWLNPCNPVPTSYPAVVLNPFCPRALLLLLQYFDYGDAAAIASTCPQLQSITIRLTFVKGPIFAPFRQLRSLSSLSMHHLDCPQQHHAVLLSSLAHLTTLTRLHINQPYSHYTTELGIGKLVALATVALLPKVASLTRLREMDVEIEASNMVTAGEALAESIVGLQHLTSLKVMTGKWPGRGRPQQQQSR